jgi:predicted O-linked N-acetylglucosamine transferase (SPINDLY family)
LLERGDAAGAVASTETLVRLQAGSADAWLLRGNALQLAGSHAVAVASYDQALRLQPELAPALNNQGHSLRMLRRTDEALTVLARALALRPDYPMALNNQGLAWLDAKRPLDALASFDAALAAASNFPEARSNRGTALLELRRYAEAAEDFARLVREAPTLGGALGNLAWARRNCCDWTDHEPLCAAVIAAVQRGAFAATPLSFLCIADAPEAQLECARIFTFVRYPPTPSALTPSAVKRPWGIPRMAGRHGRIRLAYVSGDFGAHAVSYLAAGVLERHDRDRFATTAIGWGRQNEGAIRRRLEAACERFIDVSAVADRDVAALLEELEIDIAIDLTGHTGSQRTEIFARRCAPLQVNYLGYPGTSGAPYMDYLIADAIVIPAAEDAAYSERIVRMPQCFMPTDDRRTVGAVTPTRAEAGLPEAGFVFVAFNNPAKITPEMFGIWSSLLATVDASVLWLRADAPDVRNNLRLAARAHGVDPERLVFAPPLPSMEAHLARYRLGDLFLDTLPYNAHATACDALWAGLPVLTCRGRSFAGRVATSLLAGLALPELVTETLASYRQTALEFARDPARLAPIRARLESARHGYPIFDTVLYTRRLESAYSTMWARHCEGETPASFSVQG